MDQRLVKSSLFPFLPCLNMWTFKSLKRQSTQRFRSIFYIVSLSSLFFVVNHQLQLSQSSYKISVLSQSELVGSVPDEFVIGNEPTVSYTNYTVHRLGLQPLENIEALEPGYGTVINDVLSFEYPINVDKESNLCHLWQSHVTSNSTRAVLLVVISAAKNLEKRALIRRTWAKYPKIKSSKWLNVIFLIGSLPDGDESDQDTQILIQQESISYGDVVQANVIDSYKNLTLKSVAMLHWAYTNCPNAQLVIKCDDDNYVNYEALARVAPLLNDTDSIYGTRVSTLRPARSKRHKHYVSRQVWPWPKYPFYLMGGSYALTGETIRRMLAAAQTTPLFPFEDVYMMALCAPKAGVRLRTKPAYYEPDFPGFDGLDECFIRETAIWQTLTTLEFARSHRITNRVYNKNLTCNKRSKKRSKCNYLGIFC